MVDNAQLSPRVVAGTQTRTESNHSTCRSKGKLANQYTTIASTPHLNINAQTAIPIMAIGRFHLILATG